MQPLITSAKSLSTRPTAKQSERFEELCDSATSENTREAYRTGLRKFLTMGGRIPTTQMQLRNFIVNLEEEGKRPSTIELYIQAVKNYQISLGYKNPITDKISKSIVGLKRKHRDSNRKGEVFSTDELLFVLRTLEQDNSEKGIRNHFLFLILLWSACRTEEIAQMTFENTKASDKHIKILITHSKRDQLGIGDWVDLPALCKNKKNPSRILCPIYAYNKYEALFSNDTKSGGLFKRVYRSGKLDCEKNISTRSVREIVRNVLLSCGIDKDRTSKINGHSFRHTLATLAYQLNISDQTIQKLGRWRSLKSITPYAGDHTSNAIREIANELNTHLKERLY